MQLTTNTVTLLKLAVECSIFEFNIQKSVPRSLQSKKILLFSRIEMCH